MLKKFFQQIYHQFNRLTTFGRTIYWRSLFRKMGKNCFVYGPISVIYPENVSVGKNVTINQGVMLNARAPIVIGNFVRISPGAIITTGSLRIEQSPRVREHFQRPINIDEGVWIGAGAIILPGVRIKRNSVISAGSVVKKDIPENVIAAGSPAVVVKRLPARFL